MSMQLFLSGVILGLLVGMLLEYCLLHGPQRREGKQREMNRLVEQFQQIDRNKEA